MLQGPTRFAPQALVTVIAAALLGAGVAAQGSAPQTDARLQGVVVDELTFQPVDSATVTLVDTSLTVPTDRWGGFAFPDAPFGTVSVRVTAPGHPSVVQQVEVRQDGIVYMQVALPSVAATLEGLLVGFDRDPSRSAQSAADLLATTEARTRITASQIGGTDYQIHLRGVSSLTGSLEPMIVIDGVTIAGARSAYDALLQIPASSVERIEVLKGPAAMARYPFAANGVISVTTIRGR